MRLIALLLLGKVLIGGLSFGATAAATDAAKPLFEKGSSFLQAEAARHGVEGFKDLTDINAWMGKPEVQVKKAIDAIVRGGGNLKEERKSNGAVLLAMAKAGNSYGDSGSMNLKNYYTDLN